MNAGDVREILGWARYYLDLEWNVIDEVLKQSPGTSKSWYSQEGYAGPEDLDQLQKLNTLRMTVGRVFGTDSNKAREWLRGKILYFRDQVPLAVLRNGDIATVTNRLRQNVEFFM